MEKKESIWAQYKNKNIENKLNKNIEVDVLIIGGGMTGLSSAYHLKDSNLKIALIEKNEVGMGITSKSTAKITYLQETNYSKIKKYVSKQAAKNYLDSQLEAINIIMKIIKSNNIKCDIQKSKSYLFIDNYKYKNKIIKEKELLNEFGINTNYINRLPDNEKCLYSFSVDGTYVFNPIKYLDSLKNILKNKIKIYEKTKIESIIKSNNYYICKTNTNIIKTKYVILALHYPYFLFPFAMPIKVSLEKSYVGAYKVKNDFLYNAINVGKSTKSIRYYNDGENIFKIKLTSSHNINIKNDEKVNFNKLKNYIINESDYIWSNIDIITNDYLPLIGEIDENILIGTGYNTWGMTNSTIAGKILSDIILKKDNKFIKLFNPKRAINLGKIINFPLIISGNIYSYLNSKLNIKKNWYKDNIKFEIRNGNTIGIFTDQNKKEHIVNKKCPHLGCNLVFNEIELTWDCPCHGSRFDKDGKCIEGPSIYNISYNKDK